MDVLKKVVAEITPSPEEHAKAQQVIESVVSKIKVPGANVLLGGSWIKDTWLRQATDVDVFVRFNYRKYLSKSENLSDILESALKKSFKDIERLHGSRDYFHIYHGAFTFEIVPILDVKSAAEAQNITDVSPLHAVFVTKAIAKRKSLAGDIRLLKQFCKSQRVYGAESYINGFSGYMCELLVINYGSFAGLLKAATKWKAQEVIDPLKAYKGKDPLLALNKSKTVGPLVLIDPVQADRNAAAALSVEQYDAFRHAAQAFLKKPSAGFFEVKPFDPMNVKKGSILVRVTLTEGKRDIVGCRMVKAFEYLLRVLKKDGFVVKSSAWYWDEGDTAHWVFDIPKPASPVKVIEGPLLSMAPFVADFKKKHKKTFIKASRVYAEDTRQYTLPRDRIGAALKDQYLKERVAAANLV